MSPAVRKSVRRQGWIVRAAARAMCFPKYVNSANALMVGQAFVFAVFICNRLLIPPRWYGVDMHCSWVA